MGVRMAFAGLTTMPEKGETFTPQVNGDATKEFGTAAGANGILTKTFTCRVGSTGSLENFGAAEQIDAAEDMRTFLVAVKGMQSNTFRWTHVKIGPMGADGSALEAASTYTFTTPVVGTATTLLPPQCAAAISMRANIIGRRGRGRIYLPALGIPLTSDGLIASSTATIMRTSLKSLIDNLQQIPGFAIYNGVVVIMSSGSPTAVRPVEVRTGEVVDTIKSRRAQKTETYTPLAL